MVANVVFLVLIAISFIRTISYGIYCVERSKTGGVSVFVLAAGIVFCGAMVIR